jgi:hypothetical protein
MVGLDAQPSFVTVSMNATRTSTFFDHGRPQRLGNKVEPVSVWAARWHVWLPARYHAKAQPTTLRVLLAAPPARPSGVTGGFFMREGSKPLAAETAGLGSREPGPLGRAPLLVSPISPHLPDKSRSDGQAERGEPNAVSLHHPFAAESANSVRIDIVAVEQKIPPRLAQLSYDRVDVWGISHGRGPKERGLRRRCPDMYPHAVMAAVHDIPPPPSRIPR